MIFYFNPTLSKIIQSIVMQITFLTSRPLIYVIKQSLIILYHSITFNIF